MQQHYSPLSFEKLLVERHILC